MSWILVVGSLSVLGVTLLLFAARRVELARMRAVVDEGVRSRAAGADSERLQFPVIDRSRCLGCATCVAVCPEGGVLDLVHGQAVVVNGVRCEGVSACERECPTGAITVTVANLATRRDVPVLEKGLEAWGAPGLFLAGEVTAQSRIKNAVEQGVRVAREVRRRPRGDSELDLLVVGAGPAGLACGLEARRLGLRSVVLDQGEEIGGTVARYPRHKLVLTSPLELPSFGRLSGKTYRKEELVELWRRAAAQAGLEFRGGHRLMDLSREPGGGFRAVTSAGEFRARSVCLAIGRRGVPRRLGVPGEDLPKVADGLVDAASFRGRRILVVGGGDSAIEAALALGAQPGNEVVLSYRRPAFFRLHPANQERLAEAARAGRVRPLLQSRVRQVLSDAVDLDLGGEDGRTVRLANDDVFVLAGSEPPFADLERWGVRFDPELRPPAPVLTERGAGVLPALTLGLGLVAVAGAFVAWHWDYYGLPRVERVAHADHALLRPGRGLGLAFGVAGVALVGLNLAYLLRRSPRFGLNLGNLSTWMTVHVATGVLACLCALLHSALLPTPSSGGHALLALFALLVTGGVGRYFYAWLPRAANGREFELSELRAETLQLSTPGPRGFSERARAEVLEAVERRRWNQGFLRRLAALLGACGTLRGTLERIRERGRKEGIPAEEIEETERFARRLHRRALVLAHLEDLRGLLGSWRFLHRWVALLLLFLVALHVAHAFAYGGLSELLSVPLENGGGLP